MSEYVEYIDYAGYLDRQQVLKLLDDLKATKSHVPVNKDSDEAYEIGKALGYQDAMKDVIDLIKGIPAKKREQLKRTVRR